MNGGSFQSKNQANSYRLWGFLLLVLLCVQYLFEVHSLFFFTKAEIKQILIVVVLFRKKNSKKTSKIMMMMDYEN